MPRFARAQQHLSARKKEAIKRDHNEAANRQKGRQKSSTKTT
jgi:hypothetical protein